MKLRVNQRYEKKFLVPIDQQHAIEEVIKTHPAIFSEIFHERVVHNVYFDNTNFKNYLDHINGVASRQKVRIRWYMNADGCTSGLKLEIKSKNGDIGNKTSFPLPGLTPGDIYKEYLDGYFSHNNINLPFSINIMLSETRPVLTNSYTRKYWLSNNGKWRATIDRNIRSWILTDEKNDSLAISRYPGTIVELKYDVSNHSEAHNISNLFPWRVERQSKYVSGLENFLS